MTYISLTPLDLALAATLLVLNAAISGSSACGSKRASPSPPCAC